MPDGTWVLVEDAVWMAAWLLSRDMPLSPKMQARAEQLAAEHATKS